MTFSEMCRTVTSKNSARKAIYDSAEQTLGVELDFGTLVVSEYGDRVLFEMTGSGETAHLTYEYDEAYRVLCALLDGDADVRAWFPGKPKKSVKTKSVSSMLFGALTALFGAFCTLSLVVSAIEGSDEPAHFSIVIISFFAIIMAAGIALVIAASRGKASPGRVWGVGSGLLMATLPGVILDGMWMTRNEEPTIPLGGLITLTVLFGVIMAAGVALAVSSVRRDTSPVYGAQPWMKIVPSQKNTDRLLRAVMEQTVQDTIRFTLDYEASPALAQSKVGGVPYWDMSRPYPRAKNGDMLTMLAQFDLSELPENSYFPRQGMLQIFIHADPAFGSDIGPAVVYHSRIDRTVTEKDVLALGMDTSLSDKEDFCFPVSGEFGVKFDLVRSYMTAEDDRFEGLVADAAERMGIELYGCQAFDSDGIPDNDGHRLGGWAGFAQDDPRDEDERQKYDFLLLQLSSESRFTPGGKEILWGDVGTGTFFVDRDALERMELDDVYYNWDCC